ncbi:hypothetical protein B9H02_02005 [Prosthecochloris sp. HL-130-GSB]|jgi:H+/Cl- antiporter ClcA|nr:hypothetical protein B9H02_02005 [Prosthecochloris sp. HL-130-GSB]
MQGPFKKKQSSPMSEDKEHMADMLGRTIAESYEDLLAIIDARMEILKIEVTRKIAIAVSLVIIALIMLVAIAYLITSVALFTGELLGHYYLGYLIVSGFFLLCVLLFTKLRPQLLQNIIHNILLSTYDRKN